MNIHIHYVLVLQHFPFPLSKPEGYTLQFEYLHSTNCLSLHSPLPDDLCTAEQGYFEQNSPDGEKSVSKGQLSSVKTSSASKVKLKHNRKKTHLSLTFCTL